jgi:hypothetical protein
MVIICSPYAFHSIIRAILIYQPVPVATVLSNHAH